MTTDLAEYACTVRIPPYVSCRIAGVHKLSASIIVAASIITGVLAGLLGVGGGFLRMPALVYIVGCPTHVAVGTDLLGIVVAGAYGAFTHAMKGNVDLTMALIMLVGASVGAQIGTFATRYVDGAQLRSLFAIGILIAAVAVMAKTYLNMPTLAIVLVLTMAGGMALLIIAYLIRGLMHKAEIENQLPSDGAE